MKKLLLSACLLSVTSASFAQITLSQNNVPSNPVGIDVLYNTVLDANVPSGAAAAGTTWDFSMVNYQPTTYNSIYSVATGFPGASYSNTSYYFIEPTKKYTTDLMFGVDVEGVKLRGERVGRQSFSLGTSNPADSIVILGQDINYDVPQLQMKFPATYHSMWSTTSKYKTNLTITYSPLANKAPAERRTVMVSNYHVVGWGDVKIKMLNGFTSGKVPVLQVESIISFTDSFYINGVPAPANMLSQFNMSQGQTSFAYVRSFYRAGAMTPVASITYKDAQFSQVKDVNLHRDKLPPFDAAVNDITNNTSVNIYPNPVTGHKLYIETQGLAANNWNYELTNITGQVLATGIATVKNNKAEIAIPAAVNAGNYTLILSDDKGNSAIKQVVIAE